MHRTGRIARVLLRPRNLAMAMGGLGLGAAYLKNQIQPTKKVAEIKKTTEPYTPSQAKIIGTAVTVNAVATAGWWGVDVGTRLATSEAVTKNHPIYESARNYVKQHGSDIFLKSADNAALAASLRRAFKLTVQPEIQKLITKNAETWSKENPVATSMLAGMGISPLEGYLFTFWDHMAYLGTKKDPEGNPKFKTKIDIAKELYTKGNMFTGAHIASIRFAILNIGIFGGNATLQAYFKKEHPTLNPILRDILSMTGGSFLGCMGAGFTDITYMHNRNLNLNLPPDSKKISLTESTLKLIEQQAQNFQKKGYSNYSSYIAAITKLWGTFGLLRFAAAGFPFVAASVVGTQIQNTDLTEKAKKVFQG